jgi:signal transduction histidine kinase
MVRGAELCQICFMTSQLTRQLHRIVCIAAVTIWLAWGWPVIRDIINGGTIRGYPVSPLWLVPYALYGAAIILPWAGMTQYLVIIAWQVGMAAAPRQAFAWTGFQTLVVVAALAQALNPDLCWVIAKSFALQLLLVFTAQALRREAETARALAQSNRELRSAQAIIANSVRDAERLRISRELHDAWGHELTALGLQLEIASHVTEPGRVNDHVLQAKGLARSLLAKVRDVVAALREAERCDLKDALEALAQSVPAPAIHLEISPDLRVGPDQAHALMRCAQEAVTNAVRHAQASNLWLRVDADGEGVRLVARDDGSARPAASSSGSGLLGMRERVEALGGRLAVRTGADHGFTVDAWLPSPVPQGA